jgi:hypothetical protein
MSIDSKESAAAKKGMERVLAIIFLWNNAPRYLMVTVRSLQVALPVVTQKSRLSSQCQHSC